MKVLVTGGTGFIGSNIVSALKTRGHEVVACVRDPARARMVLGVEAVACDFERDTEPLVWTGRLKGVDAVVNAVGIITERKGATFKALHSKTPKALFEGAQKAGVKKIVQISALGADERAESRYHLSKKEADDFLRGLSIDWVIVRPSLVFGKGGASTRLFSALSSLPVIPVFGEGEELLQPISIEDLSRAVVNILEDESAKRLTIDAAGGEAITYAQMLSVYRKRLGLGRARFLKIPMSIARIIACAGDITKTGPLNTETLGMLKRGNAADISLFKKAAKADPAPFIDAPPFSRAGRNDARLFFTLPVLRLTIALLWICSGLVSLFVFPYAESIELLEETGVPAYLRPGALYAASIIDIILGAALLFGYRVRAACIAQMLLMLAYTLIIALRLPVLLIHPFAPVIKNIVVLSATLAVVSLEEK
ncbi:MAG: NAD(P)H-binding protein [Deltaproteobacteria bacterium]|nr:NAD(P)H-binding protein [Deltaproteobacteria bacterium]